MLRIKSFLLIILLLICAAEVCPQGNSQQQQPLTLTAEIIDRQYCAINAGLASLKLRIRLRYTNAGSQNLILYKGHDLFYQTKIRDAGAGQAKPYEVTILDARFYDEEPEPIEQPSPSKVFVTLRPGASFEREILVGVSVSVQRASRDRQAITNGEHTMYVMVSTWYKSKPLAQKLRQQWERKGLLWSDPLISGPVNFTVEPPGPLAPCK